VEHFTRETHLLLHTHTHTHTNSVVKNTRPQTSNTRPTLILSHCAVPLAPVNTCNQHFIMLYMGHKHFNRIACHWQYHCN